MSEHLADAAVAYAHEGCAVFPCRVRRKEPYGRLAPRGLHDATTNVDQVDRWWRHNPHLNIGGRPGERIKVIDIDAYHGGEDTWRRLTDGHLVPETRTCVTPGGGRHLWFACSGPSRGTLGAGIDVKGHTGYLLLPPSRHPNGGTYRWADRDTPIAAAPTWLIDLLRPPTPRPAEFVHAPDPSRRAKALLDVVLQAQPGERNQKLFWACSRAVEGGLDVTPLIAAAVHIGLTEAEAQRTARSAATRKAA